MNEEESNYMFRRKAHYWKSKYFQILEENTKLMVYREAIHEMCSVRYNEIDDYIRVAKQAVSDYENK